jgi:cell shape-determining protein MreC
LYLAEAERQRLVEQLKRLLEAVQTGSNLTGEVERTKTLLASEKPVSQPAGKSSLETARVLEFNPKLRLAVLDVGSLRGVRVGMPFIVLRGDRVIAWARVVEVRQKICGALIEKTEGNVTVKAGDTASVTKS